MKGEISCGRNAPLKMKNKLSRDPVSKQSFDTMTVTRMEQASRLVNT